MRFWIFTFFCSLTLLPAPTVANVNQWVYEQINAIKCDPASKTEIYKLVCRTGSKMKTTQDLDTLSEHIVFSEIAKKERDRFACVKKQIQYINTNKDIKENLLRKTCEKLEKVLDDLSNEEFYQKWISIYESVSKPLSRTIPPEDSAKYKVILKDLRSRQLLYREHLQLVKDSDVLLSSPHVFEKIKKLAEKPLIGNAKTSKEICNELKPQLGELLGKDQEDVQQSYDMIDQQLKSDSGITRDSFKHQLWASASRNEVIAQINSPSDLDKSVVCRLEGRYGLGEVQVSKLKLIASLGLGGAVFNSGKLAAAFYAKRVETAYQATRFITIAEMLTGLSLNYSEIKKACADKLNAVSDKRSCAALNDSEFKNLFYKQQDANQCLMAWTSGAVFTGLSSLGIKGVLQGKIKPSLQQEIEARAAQTQKLNTNATLPKVTEVPLGEGAGGVVTLVTKSDGTSFVRKVYKNTTEFSNDTKALKLLTEAESKGEFGDKLKIIKPYEGNSLPKQPLEANFQYYNGKTIAEVMAESPEKAAGLMQQYKEVLQSLDTAIAKTGRVKSSSDFPLFGAPAKHYILDDHDIVIHIKNILVTKKGLVLIDPH